MNVVSQRSCSLNGFLGDCCHAVVLKSLNSPSVSECYQAGVSICLNGVLQANDVRQVSRLV